MYKRQTLAGEEGALAASAKSLVVPVGTKKDGMLKKNAATITTENFKELIDFTERKLQEIGVQIGAGETSMHPYQKADSMKSVSYTHLDVYKRQTVSWQTSPESRSVGLQTSLRRNST